mmetsp:Transcript_47669/g.121632  ORF Transcript_47669/g.121632 Transcript_47669/m.121632 type:complete len:204 (+) Transcript_47669:181-792(+)
MAPSGVSRPPRVYLRATDGPVLPSSARAAGIDADFLLAAALGHHAGLEAAGRETSYFGRRLLANEYTIFTDTSCEATNLQKIHGLKDHAECGRRCDGNSKCTAYTFNQDDKTCYLKPDCPGRTYKQSRISGVHSGGSKECASGCSSSMKGDGSCNSACNVWQCDWDFGDCDCSRDCPSRWTGDKICDPACNSSACGYDKGDCI